MLAAPAARTTARALRHLLGSSGAHMTGVMAAGDVAREGAAAASRPLVVVEEANNPIRPEHFLFVDNLRLVEPYLFDFKCFVKKRWEGKRLVDMFSEEFPLLTFEYYERAFKAGRLRVESSSGRPLKGPPMTLQSRLQGGMCVRHLVHRHEPPVLAGDVKVLEVTPDWVAVVKPPCMPVHTVGQYRKNTVMGVLEAHYPELGVLYPTYRLDKPVSGLLVLARSSAAAGRMRKLLEERSCEKVYVARVQGRFPATAADLLASASGQAVTDSHTNGQPVTDGHTSGQAVTDAHIRVLEDTWPVFTHPPAAQPAAGDQPADQPMAGAAAGTASDTVAAAEQEAEAAGHVIIQVDVPLTWNAQRNHAGAVPTTDNNTEPGCDAEGNVARPASTQFRLLACAPDGSSSVVECRPLTGRTHQIRKHLQYMGFPIANDTQYGGVLGKPLAFRRLRQAQQEQQQQAQPQPQPQQQQPQPQPPPLLRHQVQQEQQQQPQPEQQPSELCQMDSQSHAGSPCPCCPLKRTRSSSPCTNPVPSPLPTRGNGAPPAPEDPSRAPASIPPADLAGHIAPPAVTPGTGEEEPHCVKRQALITAFTHPNMIHASSLPVGPHTTTGTQPSSHTARSMSTLADSQAPQPTTNAAGTQPCQPATSLQGNQPPATTSQTGTVADSPGRAAAAAAAAAASGSGQAGSAGAAGSGQDTIMTAADRRAALLHEAVAKGLGGLPAELDMLYRDPRYRVRPEQEEEVCPHCPCLVPQGYPIDLEALWLHAIKYKCDEWAFTAPLPDWALDLS